MKVRFLALRGLFFLALASPAEAASSGALPPSAAHGRRLFNQSCAGCHDALSTTKKSGPGLKGFYRRQGHSTDAAVRALIEEGKGAMPGFGSLSRSEVDDLVAYLRTL